MYYSPHKGGCPLHGKDILQNVEDFYAVVCAGGPAVALRVFLYAQILYGGCRTAGDKVETGIDTLVLKELPVCVGL